VGNKKGGTKAAFFETETTGLSRAGRGVVVIASGNHDTRNDSSRSENSNDNAATAAKLAFFLRSRSSALNSGLHRSFRSSCRLSDNRGADERRSCQSSERDFTETHFFGSFFSCGFKHTGGLLAQRRGKGKRRITKKSQIVILISDVARLTQL
jgi:hypothetical protein